MTSSRKIGWLLTAVALFGLWTYVGISAPTDTSVAPQGVHPAADRHAAAASALPGAPPAGRDPHDQADASVEDRVIGLRASGDPEQALQAFQLVEECLRLERDKELFETTIDVVQHGPERGLALNTRSVDEQKVTALRKSCSTLTGRTRLDHYELLDYAVDHHAGGALALYVALGPQGDRDALRERPADPAVRQWRDAALKRLDGAIRSGYPDALMTSRISYSMLGMPASAAQAYMLMLAQNKVIGAINAGEGMYSQAILEAESGRLSQQERSDAQAQAAQIFLAWKKRQH